MATLVTLDYIVIVIMLLISSGIGIYYWRISEKKKTTEEYFVASRSMSVLPVAIGLMTSFLSSVSLLGVSSEMYTYGTQYFVIVVSYCIASFAIIYCYLPVFFNLGAASAFEYLERRYGKSTRLLASIAFTIQLLLYTSVVLYAPALALEATTGISKTVSIIVLGIVCTSYSTIGGIKAVIMTDVFQTMLMFASIIAVIVTAASEMGGLARIWEIAAEGSRIEFDNISIDPTVRHTWWSLSIGGFCTYVYLFGTNQVQVQRMLTVKNLGAAQKALWCSLPITIIMKIIMCFSGLAIYAKYRRCDPFEDGKIASYDQLLPFYVMETMSQYPAVPGLFIAGIFSAGLSTISATINSLAVVTLEDYIKPIYRARNKNISQRGSVIVSKCLTILIGLICVGLTFLGQFLGGLLQAALTIFGTIGGPMLGLYTLGMFSTSSNHRGANIGLLFGLVICFWIGFGQPKPPIPKLEMSTEECQSNSLISTNQQLSNLLNQRQDEEEDSYFYLYRISYMWYSPIGCFITFVTGWLVSKISNYFVKDEPIELDPNLLAPIVAWRIKKKQKEKNMSTKTLEMS